jgi:ABC-type lipoprotein export system ATPase subunit
VSLPILAAHDLHKVYSGDGEPAVALRGVSLTLSPGEIVALMGPSGCGKSTLLHLCGAMDRPTQGTVAIEQIDVSAMDETRLTRLRRDRVGFVFQFFNLLPALSMQENIALPRLLGGGDAATALQEAARLAARVGLGHRLHHRPSQLSAGELQRAAIARAIINRPALVIADEPTGNLDSVNGANVLDLLVELNVETNVAILLATHAPDVASAAHRIVRMKDGQIAE